MWLMDFQRREEKNHDILRLRNDLVIHSQIKIYHKFIIYGIYECTDMILHHTNIHKQTNKAQHTRHGHTFFSSQSQKCQRSKPNPFVLHRLKNIITSFCLQSLFFRFVFSQIDNILLICVHVYVLCRISATIIVLSSSLL